ncbi:MAG: tRNA 2-thiouridine(34) synthase MnmA [Proteobacteria bacterium]|nr:tRNA 2-thiouridine(34) synthase MnmA [Pseudomonadota bacterium]
MSGGVDSSTVAALLAAQGHEVIGVTMQLYDQGMAAVRKGACCAGQDIYDAQMAAAKIGIPHYVLDYESVFKQEVIEDFADSYLRGETPIPCIKCNQSVKFRDLFKVAKDLGADALATGHYVQRKLVNGHSQLHRGADISKDQSYFLFATTQEQLDYLRFPIGHMSKTQTRALAAEHGLTVADKPDSQDICFVAGGSYSDIISKLRPGALDPGDIQLSDGTVIGRHNGIINFTVGQRRGIGIASAEPLYVLSINPDKKTVTVGPKEALAANTLHTKQVNWLAHDISSIDAEIECIVKLRSAHQGIHATIQLREGSEASVRLHEPYSGITPGQACVMYDGDRVLGGGWITRG